MTIVRNSRLDGIKLLLIVLVVIGHCIEPSRYSNTISGSLYSVIYSFHMPLFVFLSGYFAKVNSLKEWRNKGIRFIETFLVIMIPQFLFYRSWHVFLNPENSGWYLMSLLWWYGILLLIKRVLPNMSTWGGVFLTVSASILVFLLPLGSYGRLFSFNRTIQMFPFFYGGYLCRSKGINVPFKLKKIISTLLLILSVVIMALLIVFSSRTLHVLEFYNVDVWSISNNCNLPVGSLLCIRALLMIGAVVISFVIIEKVKMSNGLSTLGRSTLVIYVIQGVLAHILPSLAPANFYIELVIAFGILLISFFLIRTIDCRYITNPISKLLDKYKNK